MIAINTTDTQVIDSYLDPDLAFLLEDPDVDARDLLLHVLAATIEAPEWPGILKQLPLRVFYRLCVWLPHPGATPAWDGAIH